MAGTQAVLEVLKRRLKASGHTYAAVAAALTVSTATVKRWFATRQLTLEQLDRLCSFIGVELSDLLPELGTGDALMGELSEEQEGEIAHDLKLLLVTVCVLNRLSLADILALFNLNEAECIARLARLDRLGLIELMPANRVRLRVANNFRWRSGGPIQRFFREHLAAEYFSSDFEGPGRRLQVLNGLLSGPSLTLWQRRLERLTREFEELNQADSALPMAERHGYTALLAIRPWNFGVFAPLVKAPEDCGHGPQARPIPAPQSGD